MFQMGDHASIKSNRKKNSERNDIKLRETSKTLNWEELKFPVNLVLSIHFKIVSLQFLLMYSIKKLVYPLRIGKHNYKRESTVNLLLISDDSKQHYCWIKDINKLLS